MHREDAHFCWYVPSWDERHKPNSKVERNAERKRCCLSQGTLRWCPGRVFHRKRLYPCVGEETFLQWTRSNCWRNKPIHQITSLRPSSSRWWRNTASVRDEMRFFRCHIYKGSFIISLQFRCIDVILTVFRYGRQHPCPHEQHLPEELRDCWKWT